MLSNDLIEYLKKERALDVDFETVEMALRENHWEEEQINEARLWYSKHNIDDINDENTLKNNDELPDLRGTQAEDININKSTTQHTIPSQTVVKGNKHIFETKEENKNSSKTPNDKIKITNDEDKKRSSDLLKLIIKSILSLSFVALLAIISFLFLLTYDIIEYRDTKLTNEAKAFILGLPFTPKTADYVLSSVKQDLYNKPLNVTIKFTSIDPDKKLDLNFNIIGRIFLSPNNKSYTDLTIKQKENAIEQVRYVNKTLYIKSERYNKLIVNLLYRFFKLPSNYVFYEWVNYDKYNFPYQEILDYIYQIGNKNTYFNKDAHTLRIRLDEKQLEEITTKLNDVNFSQLTKDLNSIVITLNLSDKNMDIKGIEIEASDKDKFKYLVDIQFKDIQRFTVEVPTQKK